jgi:hypothetical protein
VVVAMALFLGERLTWQHWLGGLIVSGTLVPPASEAGDPEDCPICQAVLPDPPRQPTGASAMVE